MKFALAGMLTLAVIIAMFIPNLKKYRGHVLAAYGIGAVLLSAFQTSRTAALMLPFYHAKEQTFYQSDFAKEGLYPDAILQLLVKDRTVYTKDDLDDYLREHGMMGNDTSWFDDGKYWMYQHYHQKNTSEFLRAAGAEIKAEDRFNDAVITEEQLNDFEVIGYSNDLYRYLFPLSELNDEWSNSFFYYWYYSTFIGTKNVYMNPDGMDTARELVVLWDEDETLYVMTLDYYDREVAQNV